MLLTICAPQLGIEGKTSWYKMISNPCSFTFKPKVITVLCSSPPVHKSITVKYFSCEHVVCIRGKLLREENCSRKHSVGLGSILTIFIIIGFISLRNPCHVHCIYRSLLAMDIELLLTPRVGVWKN